MNTDIVRISALLDRLLDRRDYLSIDASSRNLLDRIRASGCELEVHPQRGVHLLKTGLGVWADYLKWRDGKHRARLVEVYGNAASTQDVVRRLIQTHGDKADGAIVAADFQHAGRGRLGRRWIAPPGTAVLFSRGCVWSEATSAPTCDQLMLATTIGLCRTLERLAAPRTLGVTLRWPNDLMIDGRKLGGILVEQFAHAGSRQAAAVIGVGLNVHLTAVDMTGDLSELREQITSLDLCGVHVDRLAVLAAAVAELDQTLQRIDDESHVDEWRRRSVLLGKPVTLLHDGKRITGDVVDLSPRDGLIVRTRGGTLLHLPGASTSLVPDAG